MDHSEVLREAGFCVVEAASAEEALGLFHGGLAFHLLITDITLAGAMNGLTLAESTRSLRPGLPVVLATAQPPRTENVPADAVLPKPYSPAELVSTAWKLVGTTWQTESSNQQAC